MADVRLQLPPHSIEAEQALLGSLLIDEKAWPKISGKVITGDLFRNDHRIIFAAIAALNEKRQAVDVVTVSDFLDSQGTLSATGGLAYIGRLANDTPTAANVETYAAAVRERSALRAYKAVGLKIITTASGADVCTAAELIANAQEDLHKLQSNARIGKGLVEVRQLAAELGDDLDNQASSPQGLKTGLDDFDELTCGLVAGDLVVIAARPGMGKTALLVSISSTVSQTLGTAVFSAEMPSSQLTRRYVALHGEISQGLLRRPEKLADDQWSKISKATDAIAQRKLWIDETGAPSFSHVRAETLALKSRASLGLVLVDYVQLVRAPGANRYEQLRDVAYGLKALAKELAVPIIVLAQLNRGVEARDHKRPYISDLRDSGALEEAADIVGLLYSEGYYDADFSMPYVLECSIAKNRNGERGQCLWRFDGALSRVTTLEPGAAAQYRRLLSKPQQRKASDL